MASESDSLLRPEVSNGNHDGSLCGTVSRCFKYLSILTLAVGSCAAALYFLLHLTPRISWNAQRKNVSATASGSGSSRYSATQFISFTINTMGGLEEYGECDDDERPVDPTTGSCYLGNSKNLTEDIFHRLHIIESVLNRIKNDAFDQEPEIDWSPNVLKILVFPEFFLRGPNGAYSTSQLVDSEDDSQDGLLVKMSARVRQIIGHSHYEDFLFVFGTVITAESVKSEALKPWEEEKANAEEVLYFNFASIARGGKEATFYIAEKKYISTADFLSRVNLPNPTEQRIKKRFYSKSQGDSEIISETITTLNETVVRDNVFEIDGIRIGIEICLDHRMGSLWNNLQKNHQELVDVLIITSAGMAIERGPNPIVPGGVVYLSDGEASSAACLRPPFNDPSNNYFDPNTVCRETPGGLQHIPHGGPGYSDFFALSGCINADDRTVELVKGYYSLYQPQGCTSTFQQYGIDVADDNVLKYHPPSIEVYPTVDLPLRS